MNFIQIYFAKDEIEATLVKGFLESAGIKSKIGSVNAPMSSNFPIASSPALTSTADTPYAVYVEDKNEIEAKKILAER